MRYVTADLHGEYDRWRRPGPEAVSPFPDGRTVVAEHTPACELWGYRDEEELERLLLDLEDGHIHIFHGDGYIDLDCCCGYTDISQRRLACLRLEDMAEFYE